MRKLLIQTLVFLLVTSIWASCKKDNNDEGARYTISGNGSGNQEVPVVTTNGAATLTGTYLAKEKELRYSISYTNLSSIPTAMHFHGPADPGVNAGILAPVTGFPQTTSGNFSGVVMLTGTAEQETALLAGKMYLNIHTSNFPNGEIRAQVGVQRVN